MSTQLTVAKSHHVRRYYHVLACLNVNPDPASVFSARYRDVAAALRPEDAPRPDALLGTFHRHFRQCEGRHALPFVPLVSATVDQHQAVVESLIHAQAPAAHLSAWAKRAVAPLANKQGARLIGTLCEIQKSEMRWCLADLEQQGKSVFGDEGAGLESYLVQELLPLCETLFGLTPQQITVFPTESVGRRSWSVLIDRTQHRIVTAPNLRMAYLQAFVGLCRHRTDRLIRPFLPERIRSDLNHPLNRQMRQDAAFTVAYHVLQRHRPEHLDTYTEWVMQQFADTSRRAEAAVAGLRPMELIPEEARDAVQHLVEGRD